MSQGNAYAFARQFKFLIPPGLRPKLLRGWRKVFPLPRALPPDADALTEPDAVKNCLCCGSANLFQLEVLWAALIDEWRLSPEQVAYLNRQQGWMCGKCRVNLRAMALAAAIMRFYGFRGYFKDFIALSATRKLRVLELNEAFYLTQYFSQLPGHTLGVYPEVDMLCLPYLDKTFDLVVHSDVLEHVAQPVAALAECYRVLKPGGFCAFTIPLVVERLTNSRAGMPSSFHGNPQETRADFMVQTEYGADAWTHLIKAGFGECRLHAVEYPAAHVLVGVRSAD